MFKSKLFSIWSSAFIFTMFALFAPMAAAAPEISSFGVDQVSALDPGTDLEFTLEGTPNARVSLRITGVPRAINLKETDRGFYEGTYTVRKKDRISANAAVIATLSQGRRRALARLGENLLVANAAPTQAQPSQWLKIHRFLLSALPAIKSNALNPALN